jgi:hypothetical protein
MFKNQAIIAREIQVQWPKAAVYSISASLSQLCKAKKQLVKWLEGNKPQLEHSALPNVLQFTDFEHTERLYLLPLWSGAWTLPCRSDHRRRAMATNGEPEVEDLDVSPVIA